MSQVTKPIALDETLQDVVSAIQGITQGGMIVSTGNVGSATQPVYINGGVPTAMTGALGKANGGTGNTIGKSESVNVQRIPNDGNANVDTFTTDTKGTAQFHIGAGSVTNAPDNAWYNYLTMSASGTGADYATQFAFGATWGRLWFRNKEAGTWQPWHQIYGITTGTPTNPAMGLTLQDSQFEKSGNVVVFRVAYKITGNVTLTGGFAVCTLPWTPAYITRVTRIVGDTNDSHTQNISYGTLKTDKKLYGGPNDSQSTTGNYIEYYGTYLTKD